MAVKKRRTPDEKDFSVAAQATSRPEGLSGVIRCLRRKGFTIGSDRARRMWADYIGRPVPEVTQPELTGTMDDPATRRVDLSTSGRKTYVLTCAQNNTDLIPDHWWAALMNLVAHYNAELHISRFTYNKGAYGKKAVKPGSRKGTDDADLFFDPRIAPYASDEDVQLAPDLVWLGSANLSPTLVNPLAGWKNHTRTASCVLPHTKIAMESIPTMKYDPARFIYTTGCVTQRNYIQRGAGQKADFHHVFGALLVEVADDGEWWARQLNFDNTGTLHDLDLCFTADGVSDSPLLALVHGDIHGLKVDRVVLDTVFDAGGLLDRLRPHHQFFHDLIDFMPRNHHNRKSFMFRNDMHMRGVESVIDEFTFVADILDNRARRAWCQSHVVVSNHDQAVTNWLDDPSGLNDPPNLSLWLHTNWLRAAKAIRHPFKHLLMTTTENWVHIIEEDQSFKLRDIEFGLHGHLGPNGARGSPKNLSVVGKACTGHTHSAGIVEGVYTAGVLGNLDMEYNKGPSSWSHSSIAVYANGKRAILTFRNGRWFRG